MGSNLAIHFKKRGWNTWVIDNESKYKGLDFQINLITQESIPHEKVDIRDKVSVDQYIASGNFDFVVNCAAQVSFARSVANPMDDFKINCEANLNLLESIRNLSPNTAYLYLSTNQVYGLMSSFQVEELESRFDYVENISGIAETAPLDFLSPYGCSKGAADLYTTDYARVFNTKSYVFRLGGIYGQNQWPYEDHGWVSYILNEIAQDRAYNRFGHGKQVRDILHVSDICNAVEKSFDRLEQVVGEAFNISGGKENSLSVLELIEKACAITGNSDRSLVNPMRKADKLVCYLDSKKAHKSFDWKPKVSLAEGLEAQLQWLQNNCE